MQDDAGIGCELLESRSLRRLGVASHGVTISFVSDDVPRSAANQKYPNFPNSAETPAAFHGLTIVNFRNLHVQPGTSQYGMSFHAWGRRETPAALQS